MSETAFKKDDIVANQGRFYKVTSVDKNRVWGASYIHGDLIWFVDDELRHATYEEKLAIVDRQIKETQKTMEAMRVDLRNLWQQRSEIIEANN